MDFPQYRKLEGLVYYRINSERSFDEIKVVGSQAFYHSISAEQYPEILRIREMLDLRMDHLELSDKSEFNRIRKKYSL